jgi:hypothetical protein
VVGAEGGVSGATGRDAIAALSVAGCCGVIRARVARGRAAEDVATDWIAAALELVGPGERHDVVRRALDRVADLGPEARRIASSLDLNRADRESARLD